MAKTVQIRNKRAFEVEVAHADHPHFLVGPGEVIDVAAELADGLLAQTDNWEAAGKAGSADTAASAKEA